MNPIVWSISYGPLYRARFRNLTGQFGNRTTGIKSAVTPHIRLSTIPEGAKLPKTEAFVANYSLKLKFGSKESDGSIPGTIYLCTPDAARSFLAGKFTVKGK